MSAPRVLVLGGGLAGITAALDCADGGAQVTLLEVRRRLGGAAYSFEREGLQVDNGQHVFLRCCHAYRALLARLGSSERVEVQRRLEIPVLSPGQPATALRRWRLPAPLHLAPALARYRHLTVAQRLGAARAALALGRLDPEDPGLDRETLGRWLAAHGQGEAAVAALWDLVALPTLNLPAREASLALGAFVFQTGLLAAADAADIGFHRRPLGEIIGAPAERTLAAAGVEVRLGWRARAVKLTADGLEVHGSDGRVAQAAVGDAAVGHTGDDAREAGEEGRFSAEAVVLALPHDRAGALLEPVAAELARGPQALRSSPIVNVHVVYDRPVCEVAFAAGVGTPVQYLFDRSDAAGLARGQYLAISISAAEDDMRLTPDALREHYLPALGELLPRARSARVEQFFVTREHAATFRAEPGVSALRPGVATSVPGLVLAGAYTATGWPATLEGAVLSGHAAAAHALAHVGLGAAPA